MVTVALSTRIPTASAQDDQLMMLMVSRWRQADDRVPGFDRGIEDEISACCARWPEEQQSASAARPRSPPQSTTPETPRADDRMNGPAPGFLRAGRRVARICGSLSWDLRDHIQRGSSGRVFSTSQQGPMALQPHNVGLRRSSHRARGTFAHVQDAAIARGDRQVVHS